MDTDEQTEANPARFNPMKFHCYRKSEWAIFLQVGLIHNLGNFLDSQVLFKEQGAAVAKTTFAQFHLVFQL